jgi:hypothetical protein
MTPKLLAIVVQGAQAGRVASTGVTLQAFIPTQIKSGDESITG